MMCIYQCFYNGQSWQTEAASLYAAKQNAIAYFKPPKSKQHMISVVLIHNGNIEVKVDPASL